MTTKYHPKFKVIVKHDHKGKALDTFRQRIPLKECPSCRPKCGHCGWPFTLSTVLGDKLDELVFCSEACRKGGIPFDDPPKRGRPEMYWRHYD